MASDREEFGTTDRDELGTDELAERAEFMRSVCGTTFDDEDFSSSRLDRGVDFSMMSTLCSFSVLQMRRTGTTTGTEMKVADVASETAGTETQRCIIMWRSDERKRIEQL